MKSRAARRAFVTTISSAEGATSGPVVHLIGVPRRNFFSASAFHSSSAFTCSSSVALRRPQLRDRSEPCLNLNLSGGLGLSALFRSELFHCDGLAKRGRPAFL